MLAPSGTLIPRQDDKWACPTSDETLRRLWADPWSGAMDEVNLSAVLPIAINDWGIVRLPARSMASPPDHVSHIEYASLRL